MLSGCHPFAGGAGAGIRSFVSALVRVEPSRVAFCSQMALFLESYSDPVRVPWSWLKPRVVGGSGLVTLCAGTQAAGCRPPGRSVRTGQGPEQPARMTAEGRGVSAHRRAAGTVPSAKASLEVFNGGSGQARAASPWVGDPQGRARRPTGLVQEPVNGAALQLHPTGRDGRYRPCTLPHAGPSTPAGPRRPVWRCPPPGVLNT